MIRQRASRFCAFLPSGEAGMLIAEGTCVIRCNRYLVVGALAAVCIFAQSKAKDDEKDSAQRQGELWLAIKKNLMGGKGAEWFEHNLRYALVPGGTYELR